MKVIAIGELFSRDEIKIAHTIFKSTPTHQRNTALVERVVLPVMQRINDMTGQKNDARYLAYALEHVFNVSTERGNG